MAARRYSDEEFREILRRAIERQGSTPAGFEREDVVAAAHELGVDSATIDRAIGEVEAERELEAELARMQEQRRRALASSISTWATVNALLFAIDWLSGPGWWFQWPLVGWGFAVAMQARGALFANRDRDRARASKRLEKQRARRAEEQRRAEAERATRRRKSAAERVEKELEEAIERGVTSLLSAAARRIQAAASSLDGSDHARRIRVDGPRGGPVDDEPLDDEEAEPSGRGGRATRRR